MILFDCNNTNNTHSYSCSRVLFDFHLHVFEESYDNLMNKNQDYRLTKRDCILCYSLELKI